VLWTDTSALIAELAVFWIAFIARVVTRRLANSPNPYAPTIVTVARMNHSINVEKSINVSFHLLLIQMVNVYGLDAGMDGL